MRGLIYSACMLATVFLAARPVTAQERGIRFGEETSEKIQVGIIVSAEGGPCRGLAATIPVPLDWPEQDVKVVDEDITPQVLPIRFRSIDPGVKQMIVRIPFLPAGEEARALLTYEVDRREILPPENPELYEVPERFDRRLGPYLGTSPYIETRNRKIIAAAKEAIEGHEGGWAQVEAIYDYAREKVEYRNGKLKGALAALNDGHGDCEELTSLFIALCRVNDIPARTVWVPGHCYPEFYLLDDEGEGHWFPCQAAGDRAFGRMKESRPILQKGDNFRVPEKRDRQRYVSEFLTGKGGRPRVKWVRQGL